MILEGLVTTADPAGAMHLAAMGPQIDDAPLGTAGPRTIERLLLKPFASSQTGGNLLRMPEGVFHVTDDALLLARVVTGTLAAQPPSRPATAVRGWVLDDACRAYEFKVVAADTSQERLRLEARVVAVHEGRPFLGFNRARHAVLEGAILVTRLHLLGVEEVSRQLRDLAVLVEKTGGASEREAFRLLENKVTGGGDVRAARDTDSTS
jgi:hypothetical protein